MLKLYSATSSVKAARVTAREQTYIQVKIISLICTSVQRTKLSQPIRAWLDGVSRGRMTRIRWPYWPWGEIYNWHCRVCDESTDATIASGPILFVRILLGQQVMVRSINSIKIDDSFYSFFNYYMIMQALSDICATKSRAAGATIQPRGWLQTTRSHVYLPWRLSSEWKKAAGPHVAWAGRKY